MEFRDLKIKINQKFNQMAESRKLFEADIDKDELWELYLDSFPSGMNEIYRKRREYDCSCCRQFIKGIGGAVWIDEALEKHSIFEIRDAGKYQPVMDALDAYVKSKPIVGEYLSKLARIGQDHTYEEVDGEIRTWEHFSVELPRSVMYRGRDTIDGAKAQFRDTRNVFKRSLDEISMDAVDTVLELIASNTLYRGTEWDAQIKDFKRLKEMYGNLPEDKKDLFAWYWTDSVGNVIGRIRNHSIGVLLLDISKGMDLEEAVKRYESIVAPANYKRPKAIFTKRMLEDAERTITELGYIDSLPRRFANLNDITVNNILFSNRDAAKRISGSVFADMMEDAKVAPKKFDRVEEITAEKFIKDVLPSAREVYAYLENKHEANMFSLIAPVNPEAKTMFKWNNGFSWAYAGNMADSDIRENVKSAGGRVDGVLRFSIQWNDGKEYDGNDLDAHCVEPNGNEIAYYSKVDRATGGNLDVDITHPSREHPAVENITWPYMKKMRSGQYRFFVHQYRNRGGRSGFRAEIEFDGQIYKFDYPRELRQSEDVEVADVYLENGKFRIVEHLKSETSSREIWGVKSQNFVPVSAIMYSPNYWDEQDGVGAKHYFFALKGCVNPEKPNGFYNEYLKQELMEHKRVLEALGGRMKVADAEDQISGVGFCATKRGELVVKVVGATERVMKVKF